MRTPCDYYAVTMSGIKDLVENELVLIALFVICARISESAGSTALFSGIAPVFRWVGGAFFVAAVVYPVYDLWKTLTAPIDECS